jgi:transposase
VSRQKNEARIARAQRMHRAGASFTAIAEALDCTVETAHMWVDPEYRHRRIAQIRAAQKIQPRKAYIRKPADDPPKPVAVDPRDKTEIMRQAIELKTRGYRAQAIAALLRVPYRAVEEALR